MAAADRTRRRRRSAVYLLTRQVTYQLRLLVRSPLGLFATVAIPAMVLLAVNLLFEGVRLSSRGGIRYVQFFTPAMVAFAVLAACYMDVISTTAVARDKGVLKRLRSTPLPAWIYLTGRIVAAGLVAGAASILVLGLGAGVYGFEMIWGAVPVLVADLVVAVFCFCSLGLAVAGVVARADGALPIAWGSILPLCFISDVFQPIDSAPRWLGAVASVFPLRPFADALESALDPAAGDQALQWKRLAVMAAWGVGAAVFTLCTFRWQPATSDHGAARGADAGAAAVPHTTQLRELLTARGTVDPPTRPDQTGDARPSRPATRGGPAAKRRGGRAA